MKIIGHCGAKGIAPENTVAGFLKAIEHQVDEVELDVRVTKDGRTALVHNNAVVDPAGNTLVIAEHNFAELKKHKPDLASLNEAIEAVNKRVPILIEVKPGVPTKPVISLVKSYLQRGWLATDFRFESYDQAILLELHRALPDIATIVAENWSSIRAVKRARQLSTTYISMLDYWLLPATLRGLKKRGYEVYVFLPNSAIKRRRFSRLGFHGHANNPAAAKKWAKHGLAGVITDYPDRFEQ